MPHLVGSGSEDDMDIESPGMHPSMTRTPPPPVPQRTLTSKADLMNGIMEDNIPDFDFSDDSDDYDYEHYSKVNGLEPAPTVYSIGDSEEEEGFAGSHELDSNEQGGMQEEEDVDSLESPKAASLSRSRNLGSPLALDGGSGQVREDGAGRESDNVDISQQFVETPSDEERERWERPRDYHGRFVPRLNESLRSVSVQSQCVDRSPSQESVIESYIKAEESEFSDHESIHHSDRDDAIGSNVHVPRSLDVVATPNEISNSQNLVPELIEAPQEVQTLLNEYWDLHGRIIPPCGTFSHLKNLNHNTAGKPATWLHKSGEVLEASLYRLTGIPTDYKALDKRVLVVKGPTVGPYAVAYQCTAGGIRAADVRAIAGNGTRYRIWQGLKGETEDGFEAIASVWKGYANVEALKHLTSRQLEDLFEKPSIWSAAPPQSISLQPQSSDNGPKPDDVSSLLPENVRLMLEAWSARHGREALPCAGTFTKTAEENVHKRSGGSAAYWWHKSGIRVKPRLVDLGEDFESSRRGVIVVEGEGIEPHVVKYSCGIGAQAICYRVWTGVEGDREGFEKGCSVFKLFDRRLPSVNDFRRWEVSGSNAPYPRVRNIETPIVTSRMASARRLPDYRDRFKGNGQVNKNGVLGKPFKELRPRDSISAPQKYDAGVGSKYPGSYRQTVGKRKRDEEGEEDAESLLSSFMSPAAEKIPVALQARPSELTEHVNNNVVLMFYPRSDSPPRVRLLGSCDNVQKLFAQAIAGEVFGDGAGSGTRVLLLTFGGGQQKSRSVVENDDQDYDDLVTSLKGTDCWFIEDGALQGSLTVEVRAR